MPDVRKRSRAAKASRRAQVSLSARAFAKINLKLTILGRRADGFHEVETILQSIDLADTLTFRPRNGPFLLRVRGADVPCDHRNLVWRAADALWRYLRRPAPPSGVAVTLVKRIPTAAGLGGGSADAAATLRALPRLWGVDVPQAALRRLAARLGADVPFMLEGGTAVGWGRGEQIRPLPDLPRIWVVLVSPPFGVSTSDAYGWYRADGRRAQVARRERSWASSSSTSFDIERSCVVNDLEGPVTRRHPVIGHIRRRLLRAGAVAAVMTGSGSTVFGLFRRAADARAAAAAMAGEGWRVLVRRTLSQAEFLERSTPRLAAGRRPHRPRAGPTDTRHRRGG